MTIEELRQKIEELKVEARALNEENKLDEAEAKINEMRDLSKKLDNQIALEEEEKRDLQSQKQNKKRKGKEDRKMNKEIEARAIVKTLLGQELTQEEREAITTANVISNTGAIIPTEFLSQVETIRKGYKALKDYCHVIPVSSQKGSMPLVENTIKMVKLKENQEMAKKMLDTKPVEYSVEDYGILVPIDNSVLEDEAVNLLNNILPEAVAAGTVEGENEEIIALVSTKATAVTIGSGSSVEKEIIKKINKTAPSMSSKMVIICNTDGYDYLDQLVDNTGRPLLTDSLSVEGAKALKGKEVIPMDDAFFPEEATGKKAFYLVNLYALVKFFGRKGVELAKSAEAGFTYNQTILRALERHDLVGIDNTTIPCFKFLV